VFSGVLAYEVSLSKGELIYFAEAFGVVLRL